MTISQQTKLIQDLVIEDAQYRISQEPEHELIKIAKAYDRLTIETLIEFGVGIIEMNGEDWLLFPYPTGTQLYRRENGVKQIISIKGSKPSQSFYGFNESASHSTLIIAKSPRETMLLHQLIGDSVKVIGLASGETGTLTEKQEQYLREALKGIDSIYVLLDTDNTNSKSISMSLASNIRKNHPQDVFHVDISLHSNNAYKDITDAIRDGKDSEYVTELLHSAENIKSIKNITPPSDGYDNKPNQFPESVYRELPEKLQDIFKFVDRRKNKDILLMASLPVIAAHLDNVSIRYWNDQLSPDLFSMIIASAAAGKGYANQARQIGLQLSDYYEKENQMIPDLRDANRRSGQSNQTPRIRSLFFPANTSSRALYDLLHANNSKGLIFETEIDTMLTAIDQEWGDFSDLTRKAFHHESCSLSRKGELLTVNNPKLSIFMSGTHDQFKEMFRNTGNGLYSRFALYTFESDLEWISQRPSESVNQLHLYIDQLSRWLFELNRKLNERNCLLEVTLAGHCWDQKNLYFKNKVEEFKEEGYPEELIGNLRRSGIILVKITMIFTLLRAYQELGDKLFSHDSITAEDTDFKNALKIVDTLIDHSYYLYGSLKGGGGTVFKNKRMKQFFDELPSAFSTKEAIEIGANLNLSTASVNRYIKKFVLDGCLVHLKHGEYTKVSSN